jgi:type III pantothenate kinase
MLLVLNIGNTNVQRGIYSPETGFADMLVCPTEDFCESMIPSDLPIAGASVVPALTERINQTNRNVFWLNSSVETGIDFGLVDSSTLGADRIANAITLKYFSPLPALCVDCGTAITFEALDENSVFLGGAIAPGRAILRNALHNYTAQLPLIPFDSEPPATFGKNTVDAIKLGVDGGALGMVRELISRGEEELGRPFAEVIAVGGDAKFFTKNISGMEYGGDHYTLRGIVKAWEIQR